MVQHFLPNEDGLCEATAQLTKGTESSVSADWVYERDPERRRLDLRIIPLPRGDHIAIARAYREKIIGERNHITLRKKMREKPELEKQLGRVTPEIPDEGVERHPLMALHFDYGTGGIREFDPQHTG